MIYQEALEATEQILNKRQAEEERWLKEQFPIRSRIHSWLTSRLLKRKTENILANQWTAHSLALDACKKAGLTQHAYFLSRDLSFLQVRQEQCTLVDVEYRKPVIAGPRANAREGAQVQCEDSYSRI